MSGRCDFIRVSTFYTLRFFCVFLAHSLISLAHFLSIPHRKRFSLNIFLHSILSAQPSRFNQRVPAGKSFALISGWVSIMFQGIRGLCCRVAHSGRMRLYLHFLRKLAFPSSGRLTRLIYFGIFEWIDSSVPLVCATHSSQWTRRPTILPPQWIYISFLFFRFVIVNEMANDPISLLRIKNFARERYSALEVLNNAAAHNVHPRVTHAFPNQANNMNSTSKFIQNFERLFSLFDA